MIPWQRIKILPLLIFVAALSFSLRLSEFVAGYRSASGSAYAEQAAPPPTDPLKAPTETAQASPPAEEPAKTQEAEEEAKKEEPKTEPEHPAEQAEAKAGEAPAHPAETPAAPAEPAQWKDSLDEDYEFSEVKMELFEDLAWRHHKGQSRKSLSSAGSGDHPGWAAPSARPS